MLKNEETDRQWHIYDLKGQILGRVASEIAQLIIGKNKATFTPHIDNGDYVVAINASEIEVTGKKLDDKIYYRHSNYPGGFKQEPLKVKLARNPAEVIELAVKGMLPKNKHQQPRLRRLKVYAGSEHPHENHFEPKKSQSKNSDPTLSASTLNQNKKEEGKDK